MTRKYLLALLFSFSGVVSFGQNLPQFTHYIFNQFYLNPGAAGQFNRVQIQSTVRSQYLGYTATDFSGGGNLSTAFALDMPVARLKGGVGVHFANQNISKAQSMSEMVLSYSFHKRMGSNMVGFGIGAGFNNLSLQGEDYVPRDPDDPHIPSSRLTSMVPRLNAGIYLVNPSYQIGLSAKNLLEPDYTIGAETGSFKEKREYFLTGKYDFPISYTLDISPMFMVRSDLVSTSVEAGLMVTYNQKLWIGGNYRNQDAGSVLLGTNLLDNKLKLGYALDIVTTGADAKSGTSHELFLRYVLTPVKMGKKSVVKTPRYSL